MRGWTPGGGGAHRLAQPISRRPHGGPTLPYIYIYTLFEDGNNNVMKRRTLAIDTGFNENGPPFCLVERDQRNSTCDRRCVCCRGSTYANRPVVCIAAFPMESRVGGSNFESGVAGTTYAKRAVSSKVGDAMRTIRG